MTVSSTTNRKTFTGDAVTTSFGTSPVVFFDSSDLLVYVVVTSTGAATLLTENTHYTVTGGDGSTGTVNLAGGSSPNGAPSALQTLVIVREVPLTQEVDFVNNEATDAEVAEDALDRLTMIAQQLSARVDRSFVLADSDVSGASTELPTPEASTLLGWNDTGDALQNYAAGEIDADILVSPFMETVLDDASAAAARTTLGLVAAGAGDIWVEKAGDSMTGGLAVGTTSGVLQFPDGVVGTPGLRVGTSSATGLFSSADNSVRVSCNGTQEGAFTTSGLALRQPLDLSGAAAGQIIFPASQNAAAGANTLDDYEEGTWTIGISFGGGTTGITYTNQIASYTKIGNRVLYDGLVTLSAKGSSTGSAKVTGFPFTSSGFPAGSLRITSLLAAIDAFPSFLVDNGATTGSLQMLPNASSTIVALDEGDFADTMQLVLGGQYHI